MEIIDKKLVKKLSSTLMIEMSDEEIEDSLRELSVLTKQIDKLKTIDTKGVEPMVYPFEQPTTYLREDTEVHVLTQQEILKNAPSTRQHFFKVPKVVNHED